MITNQVTRAVFELLGDKVPGGYELVVNNAEIPLFLNKDGTTQYPQIRVAPFIEKGDTKYQKYIEETSQAYRHWQFGIFQVDIYCKNLIQAQNIYDVLERRLFDFFNLETIVFDYNHEFDLVDTHTYKTQSYALLDDGLFKDIYGIRIEDTILKRVKHLDKLDMDCFYVDNHFLYVKTDKNIHKIKIKVLTQGRLFSNGYSYSDNGIHAYHLSEQRNLSSLEDNEVERISFDLEILFSQRLNREKLPRVDEVRVKYPKANVR